MPPYLCLNRSQLAVEHAAVQVHVVDVLLGMDNGHDSLLMAVKPAADGLDGGKQGYQRSSLVWMTA